MKIKKRIKEIGVFEDTLKETVARLSQTGSFVKDARLKEMAEELLGDVEHVKERIDNYKMYLEDVNEEYKCRKGRLMNNIKKDLDEAVECYA